jgi:hypothetical protein
VAISSGELVRWPDHLSVGAVRFARPTAHYDETLSFEAHGHHPVIAANPYWPAHGAVLFADPDGWLVVLAPWVFGEQPAP